MPPNLKTWTGLLMRRCVRRSCGNGVVEKCDVPVITVDTCPWPFERAKRAGCSELSKALGVSDTADMWPSTETKALPVGTRPEGSTGCLLGGVMDAIGKLLETKSEEQVQLRGQIGNPGVGAHLP